MNHIYKVVWSKVKNCYVVVSEIARNGGKEHSRHAKKMPGGVYILPLALALNFGLPSSSQAAEAAEAKPVDLGNGAAVAYDNTKGNLTIGDKTTVAEGANKNGQHNTTIGTQTDTLRNVTEGDTKKDGQPLDTDKNQQLVDGEGQAHDLDLSTEAGGSTAVGYQTHNEGDNSTAIGNNAKISNKPVTYYVDADGNKTASADNAAWYKNASGNPTKVPQVFRDADGNTTATPQYVHTYTEKDPDSKEDVTKTEITSDATKADKDSAGNPVYNYKKEDNTDKLYSVTLYQAASNSIAAGTNVTAKGSNAVAVGYNSSADNSAVAIGDTAAAKENGVAIGKGTKASAEGSIALGKGSEANRDGGVVGWDPKTGTTSTKTDVAWQSGEGALSIGNGGASRQITNVAAGSEDSDAVNLAQLKNAMTHYYSVKTTAETDGKGNNNYLNDGATGDNALAAGVSAVATGDNATAVGYNTSASGSDAAAFGSGSKVTNGGVAVGSGATASGGGVAFGSTGVTASSGGLAVGMYGTNASSNSAAFGLNSTTATNSSVAVGSDGTTADNSSFAAGFNSKAGTNGSSSYYGHNIAVGSNTTADNGSSAFGINATANYQSLAIGLHGNSSSAYATNQSIAVGNGTNAFNFSTAIGNQAQAGNNGSYAVALGNEASALYDQTTAIGSGAKVISPYGTALGSGTSAAYYATALGNSASANYSYATAIGSSAQATDTNATAVGNGAKANKSGATALGYSASATHDYSTAVGDGAGAHGTSATALGNGASANSAYDTAIGSGAATGGGNGTALGSDAKAQSPYATALGSSAEASFHAVAIGDATASSSYALAAGDGATAKENNAVALGKSAAANVEDSVALGSGSTAYRESGQAGLDTVSGALSSSTDPAWKSTYGAISVGKFTRSDDGKTVTVNGTRQIVGVAAGTEDTDAVNVAQLKAALRQTGTGTIHDYSVNSANTTTDTNYNNGGAQGSNSLAAGVSAKAIGDSSVAIGKGAQADGNGATVIGQYAKATGQYATAFGGLQTKDKHNNIITYTNTASGASSTAFGQGAQARGAASLAFGHNTIAGGADGSGQQSVAFGEDTQALGGRSLAFGEKTIANYNDSVAFGNDTRALSTGATAFGNRTRALSQYATAWGNATVAADEESTAWGTDTIAGAKLDENGAVTNKYTEDDTAKTEQMDVHGNLAYVRDGKTAGIKQMQIDSGGELHDYVVLAGKDGSTYVRDYQGSLWKVNVAADGTVTVDTTAGTKGKVYNGQKKTSLAKTTVDGSEVDINPDNVLTKAHEGSNGYTIEGYANATAFGYSTEASGDNATAFGNDTKAAGAGATAFGYKTLASGENATAFGESSIAAGKNSLAVLGGTTTDAAINSAAIGKDAKANLADSVALGSGAVADRASGAKGYDMLTKGDTTNPSTAWVSNANAIAVGNGSTLTRQITGVAAGSQDTDAVNVAQLKVAGFKVTTQNNGSISSSILNGDTLDFEAKDNAIVSTSKDSKTVTVAVSRTPTFDSATFYNPNPSEGQNNEKVTISNGHISTYNKDQQERAVLGTDNQGSGTLHLINNDLSQVHVYTQNSKEDGNDGITRMYYISSSGNGGEIQGIHTIAVLDDGINYAGDNVKPNTSEKVVVKHKLNSTMDITGGADTSNLSEGNIGVVATPAVEDEQGNITQKGKLEIKLNKDVVGLNTVTAGTAKIGHTDAGKLKTTQNGAETGKYADAGDYVTGLTNKNWDTKNPEYVSGRAATEDELATVSGDVTTNANNITNNATNIKNNADTIAKGLSFTTNTKDANNTSDNYKGYKVVNRQLGDTISINANDADTSRHYATTNLTTEIANNGDITIKMDENPTFNIVTATSVNLSPKDTTTKDQAGNTASARLDAHYRDASLNPNKNVTMADGSTGMVRLHYHDGEGSIHDLATMDDGQIYAGDIQENGTLDTTGFGRKMNEKTTINGGVTDKDNLTDNNIGVVSNGTNTLTVKLAKNLKNLQSVQTGRTTMDDNGLTIKKSDDDSSKNVIVLGDQVAFGDNQVNHMGSGSDGTADGKPTYNTDTNGANIGDVKNIASSTVQPVIDTVNKGWELDVNGTKQKAVTPDSPKVNLIQGQNITIAGDKDNTDNVTIATADDVRFNTVRVGGVKNGDTYNGGIVIGIQSGKNADGTESANSNDDYYITGLKNTNWDSTKIQSGRAATEDQLQAVATEIKNGTVKGDVFVTGGSVTYNGEGKDTKPQDGKGSINLTRQNGTDVHIDGLHDYYVTGGTVTNDGKTLELTRSDIDDSGSPKKITVDMGNVLKNDQHLVTNPDATDGKYTVNTTDGTVTLKVKNGEKYDDITIGGFEGLGKGLKFGANKMAVDGGGNPVTNQLGSTINITGAGMKELTDYSGKNLLTSVEQDDQGNTIVHVLMDKNISADGVTVGQAGKDGVAGADGEVGQAGTIGINGKNGVAGTDGKQGITTTIIRTEKGQTGKDGEIGQQGAPGVDGKDITRIVYQNDQDKVDGKDGSHTVATLDDGLKFSGDDESVITRKLNEKLQFVGGADKNKLTENNIGINEKDGKLTIQLVNTPNLGKDGNLTAGSAQIGWVAGDTLDMTKDGTNPSGNKARAGSYATGLSNKDWNVANPEYVSGRAATEDQLKVVSDAIRNRQQVNTDYQLVKNPNKEDGSYTANNGELTLTVRDTEHTNDPKYPDKTITIKDIASKTKVDEAFDRTVKYDLKDDGTVDKTHVTFEAKDAAGNPVDTQVSHMASGASEIQDDGNGHKTYVYNTDNNAANIGDVKNIANSLDAEVTKKGLNFKGNDGQEVHRDLGTTLNIVGGINDQKALDKKTGTTSSKNLGVRKSDDNSLEIVMTDTPDFTKVTVGEGNGTTKKIIIGKQTVTGTKSDGSTADKSQTGNYITGLDNKAWDKDNVVENRAATEGQLRDAINSVNGSVDKGFGLADEAGKAVTKKLGDTITVKGETVYNTDGTVAKEGNIKTTVKDNAIQISLNDQISIGQKGEQGEQGQPGTPGKDGKFTVETSKGTTVVIGHDGEPGKDGKDGLFVTGQDGKDGKSGVSITGPDGVAGKDGVDGKVGIAGKDGKDAVSITGKDGVGHIGLTGPKGEPGADGTPGKDGISIDITTDLKSATLDDGKNIKTVIKDKEGKETTIEQAPRIEYKNGDNTYEVATMDDGLKFAGDDVNTTVAKKLNSTLQIRGDGTYDEKTKKSNGNIQTSVEDGTIKVALNDKINLHQDGSLTVGGDKQDGSTNSKDPIVIKHFDDKTLDVITGVDENGKPITAKEGKAGDYVTGLDNKDWNVDKPEYVSGRAATEDQLKKVSDAVNKTAGQHTVVTVNDNKNDHDTKAKAGKGTFGDYAGTDKDNLLIAAKDEDGKLTYNIKLNDQLTIGQKGEPGVAGKDGKDGKVTVETKGGTTVVIGHDGKDGEPGSDGFFVTGKDGKSGVSITGPNGAAGKDGVDGKVGIAGKDGRDAVSIAGRDGVGHIGLTGPKGEKGAGGMPGKDGISIDITTDLKSATLDDGKNVKTVIKDKDGKETTITQAPRIQYDSNGKSYEVATMDDGLKFVGNDGKEVTKKLNSTMSLTGGMDKDAVAKASSKNLGVRSNAKGDGLELVMTDTPDFTKVTVGEGTDTTQKIIIGKQTVTGKKSDGIAGTAETGKYITGLDNTKWNKDNVVENRAATEGQLRDIAGSITNQTQGGGFGLADEAGNTVKKDLGQTVTVKGDGKNIETKVVNGSLEVSLKKDVDLGGNGSINAGQTKVDQNGVDTNKVTIKDSGINISKDGINGGGKQITNIASGIDGKTYADAKDNNAASIGDVKNIAGKVEQNVTNVTENVNQIGQHVDKIQTDVTQLQQDVKADRQYQGDDAATKKSVNVKFGRFLSLTGGAKVEALADEGNLGVIQQEKEDPDHKGEKLTGLSIRLAKDLKGLNSVEANTVNAKTVNSETFQAGNTTINNGGMTVKGDDKHKDITVQQGSVNMGGNKIEGVAPGKVAPDSTEAINGSQLAQRDQAIGKLGGEVSSLDRRVDRVGAGAAALAALHPQDFDPDDKWDFAVGYGNYRGANAAAVGAFYRPNEDTTLSVGGTVGGGENMVNAGISFKFGQGNHVTNSRVAMAKELLALKDYVQKQDEKIEKLEALVGQQGTAAAPKRRSILFPDVPENHWAYAYVKKLADRGLLEGYPDGEFKGDRTITRYEFAAIFSRALENGASVDGDMERMSEEFEPEIRELSLNRFRVDRVEGKDNDRHKIERVRVNDRDELVKQKNGEQKKRYRDLYGSVIEKDTPADAAK